MTTKTIKYVYCVDMIELEKNLIVDKEYTVDKVIIKGELAYVKLEEIPNVLFNITLFEDVKKEGDMNMDRNAIIDYSTYYSNAEVCEMLKEFENLQFARVDNNAVTVCIKDSFIHIEDSRTLAFTALHIDDEWYRMREKIDFEYILNNPSIEFSVQHELIQGSPLEYAVNLFDFLTTLLEDYSTVQIAEIIKDGQFYLDGKTVE